MTVHVIDSAHPLPPTYGERENALNLANGDMVLLAAGSEIAAYGRYSYGISSYVNYIPMNLTLMLDGRVHGASLGVSVRGTVNIGPTGHVSGGDAAINVSSDLSSPAVVTNSGKIESSGAAINLMGTDKNGTQTIVNNSGEIRGSYGVVFNGRWDDTARVILNNTGLIEADVGSLAVNGADFGSTNVRNAGHIVGDIGLGHGDDIYDGRGGTLVGRVFLVGGNDIAYGGNGSEEFSRPIIRLPWIRRHRRRRGHRYGSVP